MADAAAANEAVQLAADIGLPSFGQQTTPIIPPLYFHVNPSKGTIENNGGIIRQYQNAATTRIGNNYLPQYFLPGTQLANVCQLLGIPFDPLWATDPIHNPTGGLPIPAMRPTHATLHGAVPRTFARDEETKEAQYLFNTIHALDNAIKAAFIAVLPSHVRTVLLDQGLTATTRPLNLMSAKQVFLAVQPQLAITDSKDVATATSTLTQPFTPEDMSSAGHLARALQAREQTHLSLPIYAQMPFFSLLPALRDIFGASGPAMSKVWEHFNMANVHAPAQTWASLTTFVTLQYDVCLRTYSPGQAFLAQAASTKPSAGQKGPPPPNDGSKPLRGCNEHVLGHEHEPTKTCMRYSHAPHLFGVAAGLQRADQELKAKQAANNNKAKLTAGGGKAGGSVQTHRTSSVQSNRHTRNDRPNRGAAHATTAAEDSDYDEVADDLSTTSR